jgi:hypothetical protein
MPAKKNKPRKGQNSVVRAVLPSLPSVATSSVPAVQKRTSDDTFEHVSECASEATDDLTPKIDGDSALEVSGRLRLNGRHLAAIGATITAIVWLWLNRQ